MAKKGSSTSEASKSADEESTSTPTREPCTPSTSKGEGDSLPKVIATQVKVHIKLLRHGQNFIVWDNAFTAANSAKGSLPAIQEAMPGTIHNAAAMLLMYESVPEEWLGELSSKPSAYDAYVFICKKFVGGYNTQANAEWLKEMAKAMKRGETISQYVSRMINLKSCLKRNGHDLLDGHVATQIVQGLPAAANPPGLLPTAVAHPLDQLADLISTTAEASGYNDDGDQQAVVMMAQPTPPAPVPAPAACALTQPKQSADGDSKVEVRGTCNYCHKKGHFWRDCRKRQRDAETQRNVVAAVQQLAGMWPQGQFPGAPQPPPTVQHAFPGAGAFLLLHPPTGPPSPPSEEGRAQQQTDKANKGTERPSNMRRLRLRPTGNPPPVLPDPS
eukprot:jgi/Botrbrau1/9072/Bobra.178_2s0004.1